MCRCPVSPFDAPWLVQCGIAIGQLRYFISSSCCVTVCCTYAYLCNVCSGGSRERAIWAKVRCRDGQNVIWSLSFEKQIYSCKNIPANCLSYTTYKRQNYIIDKVAICMYVCMYIHTYLPIPSIVSATYTSRSPTQYTVLRRSTDFHIVVQNKCA